MSFGKMEKRKKGVGKNGGKKGQEIKGAFVLLSGFFVVKNWPPTLFTETLGQIFLCHTHFPVTTCHTTKLSAHTSTYPHFLLGMNLVYVMCFDSLFIICLPR